MHTSTKAVYYYHSAAPTMVIEGDPKVAGLVQRSLSRLSGAVEEERGALSIAEQFRQVPTSEFLETMAGCFEVSP